LAKNLRLYKDHYISVLLERIDALTLRLDQAEQEIMALKAENSELKARLSSNSTNSSKPPSSDGYTKKPALPKKIKGVQGGQSGHSGTTLQQVENPDKVIQCLPSACRCGHVFTNDQMVVAEKRQVFDLPQPRLEVTEYQIHKAICPVCGLLHKGIAPEGITAPAQYGNSVKAYTTLLNVHYKLPFKKIQLLFTDLFGYAINESTVYSATQTCYEKLQTSETIIQSKIGESEVAHADETGLRVEGSLHWLHVTTTTLFTYLFVHQKRGDLAIRSEQSVLKDYSGWLIHDCWSTYFNLTNAKHGICGAHILRELQALIENDHSKWAKAMKALLLNIYLMPFEERVKRRQLIESRYDLICTIADRLEPPPLKTSGKRGKYKRTKGRNLLERLAREKNAALAFAFNQQVPFTNNLAERDLRPAKVKQKISNCFRSQQGAKIYARIESFISTTRKHNQNVFNELFNTFVGDNFLTSETGW